MISSYREPERLQSVGKEAQAASRQYILRNDIDTAWMYIKSLKGAKLDIVLDNGMQTLSSTAHNIETALSTQLALK